MKYTGKVWERFVPTLSVKFFVREVRGLGGL